MCDDKDVQKLTFDYLYKRVVMMNPWQIKLTLRTLNGLIRGEALAPSATTSALGSRTFRWVSWLRRLLRR